MREEIDKRIAVVIDGMEELLAEVYDEELDGPEFWDAVADIERWLGMLVPLVESDKFDANEDNTAEP